MKKSTAYVVKESVVVGSAIAAGSYTYTVCLAASKLLIKQSTFGKVMSLVGSFLVSCVVEDAVEKTVRSYLVMVPKGADTKESTNE